MESSLICIYNTQQILPALAAIECYRYKKKINPQKKITIFLFNSSAARLGDSSEVLDIIKRIINKYTYISLHITSKNDIKYFSSAMHNVYFRAKYLRKIFLDTNFTEIVFSHDITSDYIAQSFMKAFPSAMTISFGDAFGTVYTNKYFTKFFYPIILSGKKNILFMIALKNILLRFRRLLILNFSYNYLEARYAIVILPSDPGGDFLTNKILLVPDRDNVLRLSNEIGLEIRKFSKFCELDQEKFIDSSQFILLIGNYHESKMMSLENELEMYRHIVLKYAKAGDLVTIKAHPSSNIYKANLLREIIRNCSIRCEIYIQSALPIEFLMNENSTTQIISLSYSTVILKYLYKLNVIHAINDDIIKKFFKTEFFLWVKINNDLYLNQLRLLKY